MDRNEAIELLKNMHWSITTKMNREVPSSLALLMAIKALAKDINVPTKEIIHCKECKFYGRADKRRFYRGSDCLNKRIDTIVPDRDFCSRAEKRGETDE